MTVSRNCSIRFNDADLIGGNEVLLRFRYRQFQDIPDIITIYFF